jgi:tetratricopeptide (TPR) repeat protein
VAGDKGARIEKARQLAESGEFTQAIDAWRQLLDGIPNNDANVYNTIGDLCLKSKATPDAIDAYSKAARCYLQDGFHLKAVALYKKILKLDPNRAEVYTLLGDLNVVRGLMNNAVADYLSGAKTYLKIGKAMNALTLFRKITRADPQNTDMRLRVAELCLKENLTEEAIEEYLRIGHEYQRLGRAEDAGRLYEQILRISPGHSEARRLLDNPYAPVADAPELAAPAAGELTVADAVQSTVALETPAASELVPAETVASAVADDLAALEAPQEADAPAVEAAAVSAAAQPEPAPPDGLTGSIEFNIEGLEFEPHSDSPAPPAVSQEVEASALEVDVDVAAASLDLAALGLAVVEESIPGEILESPAGVDSSQATGDEFETLFAQLRKGDNAQAGDEEFNTHYDLGVAYKEMGLIAEAIEEFQSAMRGSTRFVDACAMIAACYKVQHRNQPAIALLDRVLADARCGGPGVPYVKYDLAVLYEDEGLVDKAVRLYKEIPSIRDAEARLRRLLGSDEPTAHPPAGTRRPVSYL